MNFRDKAIFRIHRDTIGDCTLDLRRYMLGIYPYWVSLGISPMSFPECLDFIKEWCCYRNIGVAEILDPDGFNKHMVIGYRRYKGEDLRKLKQW